MLPRLLSVGPFTLYSYGALLAVGFLLGLWLATVRARKRGIDSARILDLGVIVLIAAVAGAKVLLLLTELPSVLQQPREILTILRSGGVFYGGLIAAIGAGVWYVRRNRLPLWTTCDVLAPSIALGHVVGRLGCLAAGCCFGRPTSLPWGITFHDPFAAAHVGMPLGIALHPTQLYEAGAEALILVVLLAAERYSARIAGVAQRSRFAQAFPGQTFCLYLALYAVSRFVIEFFRGDERGMLLGVSTSQFISLVILPCSLLALVLLARHGRLAPAATGSDHGRTAPAHR